MTNGRIRHTVIFTLKHPLASAETDRFLQQSQSILSAIPGVEKFEVLRQVSPKTSMHFGFSMEFASQAAYDAYNTHFAHQSYVKERWNKEVDKYQEIDFTAL